MSSNARKIISLYSIAEAQQINIDSEEYQKKKMGVGEKLTKPKLNIKPTLLIYTQDERKLETTFLSDSFNRTEWRASHK